MVEHIYFLVHSSHQRFKIGKASSPLRRWRAIQPHDQTDFVESRVFDLAPNGSAAWVEKTLHRVVDHARLDMPPDIEGHTEWFHYGALDTAREYAHREQGFLGIGEGYAIPMPTRSASAVALHRHRSARVRRQPTSPRDPTAFNEETVTATEARLVRLLDSGSLLGSRETDHGLQLYFRQDLISIEEMKFHSGNHLISILRLPSGQPIEQHWCVFSGMRRNGRHIRLSAVHPFYISEPLDTMLHPAHLTAGGAETWQQTTPGVERVRAAIARLVASAPDPVPEHIVDEMEVGWGSRLGL